jgi:hypothetical protein
MADTPFNSYTVFDGYRRIASGSLHAVASVIKQVTESKADSSILIFDDTTGRSIDIDLHGSEQAVLARLAPPVESDSQVDKQRGRGRPKLGVVPREVTLLPRHWEWLATQPGGASVALRKLVEEARRANADKDKIRKAQERAYRFMSALTGDLPGFEEASRALFANDRRLLTQHIASWTDDVRDYLLWLAFDDTKSVSSEKNESESTN